MYRKSRSSTKQTDLVSRRRALYPYRCYQCNRYFHEFWFSTSHKKKHKELYKKFWLRKGPFFQKKSRLDELCEKMMAQRQSMHLGEGASLSASSSLSTPAADRKPDRKHYNKRYLSNTNQDKIRQDKQDLHQDSKSCGKTSEIGTRSNIEKDSHLETAPSNVQNKNPSDGMNFLCPQCGSGFSKRKDLIIHKQEHGKDHPFRCQLCSKSFLDKLHLVSHQETTHAKETTCDSCHETFLNEDCFKSHKCAQSDRDENSKESRRHCDGSSKGHCTLSVFKSNNSSKCQYCNDGPVEKEKEPSTSSTKDQDAGTSSSADSDCCCTLKQLLEQAIDKQLPLCGDCDNEPPSEISQRTVTIGKMNLYNDDSLDSEHEKDIHQHDAKVDMEVVSEESAYAKSLSRKQRRKGPRPSYGTGESSAETFRPSSSIDAPVIDVSDKETGAQSQRILLTNPDRYYRLSSFHHRGHHSRHESLSVADHHSVHESLSVADHHSVHKSLSVADHHSGHESLSVASHSSRGHCSTSVAGHPSQQTLDVNIPESRRAGFSHMESNNNKEDYPVAELDREDPIYLAISRQPLVKSLTVGKAPVMVSKRKGGKKAASGGHKVVALENKSDQLKTDKPNELDQEVDDASGEKSGMCNKKQKLIHTITDKLTEAIIHDLKGPEQSKPNPEMKPLDLSIAKPVPMRQSFADRSNLCASNHGNASPRRPRENLQIRIPTSFQGQGDSAIEKELLKFYGQAITYIGLTVYKEHEKELYGHDLSQVGLLNTGKPSDVRGNKQP